MTNRFDQSSNQKYVSQYVPIPLEGIASLAQDYSTKYKQGKDLPNQLDLLASKIKAAPMDYDLKNQLLDDTKSKIKDLVNKARPEDYAKPEYQDKIKRLITDFTNDERLNTIISNKKWFDDEYTKYKSNSKNSQDLDFTLEQDSKHPTGFKQNLQGKSYTGLNITPYKESYDDTSKIMSNIPAIGDKTGVWDFNNVRTINNGETQVYNKTTKSYETVTKDQVAEIAKNSTPLYGRTDSGLYRIRKALLPIFGSEVQNMTYDNLHEAALNDPEAKKIFEHVNNILYDDLNRTGFKQIFSKFTKDEDISKETNRDVVAKHKDERNLAATFNSTGSGDQLLDLTDPAFKQLKEAGILTQDESNNIKVDYSNPLLSTNKGTSSTNQMTLAQLAMKAAKTFGLDPSKINVSNRDELFTKYGELLKSFVASPILEKTSRDVYTNEVKTDLNNFDFIDSDGKVVDRPTDLAKTLASEKSGFTVTNMISKDGKTYLKGSLLSQTGTKEDFLIRPKSKEFAAYHDKTAEIGDAIKDYIVSDKKSKNQNPIFDRKGYDQIKQIPGNDPNSFFIVYAEPNNKQEQSIVKYVKEEKGLRPINYGSYKTFLQQYNDEFKLTPEGRALYQNINAKKGEYDEEID